MFLVDPAIDLAVDMFDEFAVVPTTCDYSEMFVGLNLTCMATKPVDVIPALRVSWFRDGSEVSGAEYTDDNETVVTTTVMLDSADFVDANYTCLAELIIPESLEINNSHVHEVVFKGRHMYRSIGRF